MKNSEFEALTFLDNRKSVRFFDKDFTLSNKWIEEIIFHAMKAPSGNNFQPWKVVVIKDKEKQKVIKELAYGQQQIEDASALFFILGDRAAYDVEKKLNFDLKNNILRLDQMIEKKKRLAQYFENNPDDISTNGVMLDSGLFAMNLMHVLRAYGLDSVPMRGINFKKTMELLNIDNNYDPILMIPVGKAIKAGYPTLRYNVNEILKIID